MVVQGYGRRALPVIRWLDALAQETGRRIMVRLVKGAYWDTEIKRAQVTGTPTFPVFTRKCSSDVSYVACARALLDRADRLYPQFATHNAHSVCAVLAMAKDEKFEFQRLHGMGEALYETVRAEAAESGKTIPVRIYAPVGAHEDLLAYLVRRLLENGANSSFANQVVDERVPPEQVAQDPFDDAGLRQRWSTPVCASRRTSTAPSGRTRPAGTFSTPSSWRPTRRCARPSARRHGRLRRSWCRRVRTGQSATSSIPPSRRIRWAP